MIIIYEPAIKLTAFQINLILQEERIVSVKAVENNKLIVVCSDGFKRMIKVDDGIEWIDSW